VGGNVKTLPVIADKDTLAPGLTAENVVAIGIENADDLPLSGTVDAGSTVTIVANDEDEATPATDPVTATLGEEGSWSAHVNVNNLSDGQITFVIRAVDSAGNVTEVVKTATKFTVSVNDIEETINDEGSHAVPLSGTVEVGATVTLVANDDDSNTPATEPVVATVDAEGNWTANVDVSGLSEGSIAFTVTASKGGKSANATTEAVKDALPPELDVDEVAPITADNEDSVALSGKVTAGSTVTIVADDADEGTEPTSAVTAVVDAEGNWSATINVSGLSDGTITFTVTASDTAGNQTVATTTAQKDSSVNPLAFADSAFGDEEDWLSFD
jgi:phosphotransferase system IIB component